MTTSPYPAYRAARSEWLDFIPDHWNEGTLRWLSRRYAGGTPDKAREDYWADGTIPWLNSGSVNQGLIREPSAFITEDAFANSSARWVPSGALVMALAGQGKTKGMVAQLGLPSTCNQSMAAIVPNAELEARFLYWWLNSNYQNLRNMAGGDNRDGLNLELLGNVGCPVPPLDEQATISAFLDRETRQIDALVEAQRRLIELLKEKRQAVISHAVTKGLDPAAPMKDSGVEWLDEVPAHWSVGPVKHLAANIKAGPFGSALTKDTYSTSGYRVYGQEQVIPDDFSVGDYYISAEKFEELSQYSVSQGDLLISCVGTFGKIAIFPADAEPGIINPRLIRFRPNDLADPTFLSILLRSTASFEQFTYLSRGGTMDVINIGILGEIKVPVPPLPEQVRIAHYLSGVGEQLDRLSEASEAAIALLQERRSALICAAVTGKIDVRGLVTDQPERDAA